MNESHPSPDPCPFCSGEPNVQGPRGGFYPEFRVFCDHGPEHAVFIGANTEAEAIAAWNHRAGEAAPTPAGWKLVPPIPTTAMSMAFHAAERYSFATFGDRYKAMLAASPPTGQAIPAPSVDALPQWQDIETAPKDGTHMLLALFAGYIAAGHYDDDPEFGVKQWIAFGTGRCEPTHWLPLPLPPAQKGTT